MSAGHGHSRPNLKHVQEFDKLSHEGGFQQLMQRWQKVDTSNDIPDLAGYNVAGTVRFLDRDFFHAVHDPGYAVHILGEPIDTGLSAEDTVTCILEHEADEKTLLDALNPINSYPDAHEMATTAEHRKVIAKGSTPLRYERGLRKIIGFCAHKQLTKVPIDLCCAPYLDDPDANDRRVLKRFRELGVIDASKLSKRSVDYSLATGPDQCRRCKNWQQVGIELSPCAVTEGLVRNIYWCTKYGERNVQAQGGNPQRAS